MSTLNAQRDNRDFAYELKFYIGNEQAGALKDWVRSRLDPDPHGGGSHGDCYQVSSVYFDTPAFDVLGREGSYGRSKYRIRRYDHSDTVYLERKTRGRSHVFKRRSPTSMENLPRLLAGQPSCDWDGRWFHRRLVVRTLNAVSRVDYRRIARIGYTRYGPVRLTLDQELCAWRSRAVSFDAGGAGTALSRQRLILELKFGHIMPAVFKELIREFAPRLEGISKYRLACAALGLSPLALAPVPLPSATLSAAAKSGAAGVPGALAVPGAAGMVGGSGAPGGNPGAAGLAADPAALRALSE